LCRAICSGVVLQNSGGVALRSTISTWDEVRLLYSMVLNSARAHLKICEKHAVRKILPKISMQFLSINNTKNMLRGKFSLLG
jgi:hypothetical protein